jgi:hypothetical protein
MSGAHFSLGDGGGCSTNTGWFSRLRRADSSSPSIGATPLVGSLLIGIESSAPLKTDLFGKRHGLDGASKVLSAFGKRKWRDYEHSGCHIPKARGGIRMDVDADSIDRLERLFSQLKLSKPSDRYTAEAGQSKEKQLLRDLLQSSANEAEMIIEKCFDLRRSVQEDSNDGQSSSDGFSVQDTNISGADFTYL